jgi:hypothetical protein
MTPWKNFRELCLQIRRVPFYLYRYYSKVKQAPRPLRRPRLYGSVPNYLLDNRTARVSKRTLDVATTAKSSGTFVTWRVPQRRLLPGGGENLRDSA